MKKVLNRLPDQTAQQAENPEEQVPLEPSDLLHHRIGLLKPMIVKGEASVDPRLSVATDRLVNVARQLLFLLVSCSISRPIQKLHRRPRCGNQIVM